MRSLHLNGLTDEVTLSLAEESLLPGERTVSVPVYEAGEEAEGLPFDGNKLTLPGYVLVQPSATLTIDLVLSVDDDRTHDREYRALPVRFEGGEGGRRNGLYRPGGTSRSRHSRSGGDCSCRYGRTVAGG
ncbi:hypothetical protein NXW72_08250 [Bacteroides fragilis]|nr:hypothetical protein [Bacteroides fragilis]MCS2740055.1 hypothetical protein [Bacteroides fragilis]